MTTIPERVVELREAMRELHMIGEDEDLLFVMVYCNGCSRTLHAAGDHMVESLERQAVGWRLGGIYEEADFCPGCIN